MARILTLLELESLQRVAGERGIFVRYQNMRCRACDATIFVPKWHEGRAYTWENVPTARELMHEQGGCPSCHPEMNWEISSN